MKYEIQLEQSLESGSFRKDLEETHHSWWYHVKNMVSSSLFFLQPTQWIESGLDISNECDHPHGQMNIHNNQLL